MTEKLERYNPINPLPEEIQALPADETVCKFCGVSYLIHNEIKKLERELAECRAQLTDYKGMKVKFLDLEKQNSLLKENLDEFQCRSAAQTETVTQLGEELRKKSGEFNTLRDEYSSLNDKYCSQALLIQQQSSKLADFQKTAKLYPYFLRQIRIIKEQKEQHSQELQQLNKVNTNNLKTLSQYLNIISGKAQQAESRMRDSLNETMSLKSEITSLQRECRGQRDKLVQRERELDAQRDRVALLESSSTSLNRAQQQNVQLTKLVSETQTEVEAIKEKLSICEEEKVKLKNSVTVKSEDNAELKQRLNDLTRRHTAQIGDLNKKYHSSISIQESLKDKINLHVEGMVRDKEQNALENSDLKTENSKLNNELGLLTHELCLIEEKTRNISESHRIQLSDLHVSYQEQLNAALSKSSTYKQEIEKLEDVQHRHNLELRDVMSRAAVQHEAKSRDIENMYKRSHRDLEKQIDALSQQYSNDLRSKEQAIREIEKSFSLQLETLKSEKSSLAGSISQLNSQIATYERMIKELECRPVAAPLADPAEFESLKSRNSQLEGEVLVLQRIVQKECEERMELTEKLNQINSQVCDSKMREKTDVSSRTSLVSSASNGILKARPRADNNNTLNKNRNSKKKGANYARWLEK